MTSCIWDACEEEQEKRNRRIIALRDRCSPRKFIGYNNENKEFYTYRVDDCIISGEHLKCDFLLINEDEQITYFVELKGSDVKHAVMQIENTLKQLIGCINGYKMYNARIVCSKNPPAVYNNPKVKSFKDMLRKEYNGNLVIKSGQLEENL